MPDLDYLTDRWADDPSELTQEEKDKLANLTWSEQKEYIKKLVIQKLKDGEEVNAGEHWTGYSNPTELLVVLKNGQSTKLGNLVQKVFSHEAFRDG